MRLIWLSKDIKSKILIRLSLQHIYKLKIKIRNISLIYLRYINNYLVMTLACVFVTQEITAIYKKMFQKVFSLMSLWLKYNVHWKHIYNDDIAAVTMNMNLKQYSSKFNNFKLILNASLMHLEYI